MPFITSKSTTTTILLKRCDSRFPFFVIRTAPIIFTNIRRTETIISVPIHCCYNVISLPALCLPSSGSRGGPRGPWPPRPGPVKIGHKKDGCQRRPHRFHVSRPPPYPAAGSATVTCRTMISLQSLNNCTLRVTSQGSIFK